LTKYSKRNKEGLVAEILGGEGLVSSCKIRKSSCKCRNAELKRNGHQRRALRLRALVPSTKKWPGFC